MTLAEAHILLVDDEPVLRMTLALLLRQRGATVTEAADGAEALALLRVTPGSGSGHVDLLLTDRNMPNMDGPALLQALAAEGRSLPTVMCAGNFASPDEADPAPYGVRATLLKPFTPARLLALLDSVLQSLPQPG